MSDRAGQQPPTLITEVVLYTHQVLHVRPAKVRVLICLISCKIQTLWTLSNYAIHHWFLIWIHIKVNSKVSTNKSLWWVILKSHRHLKYNINLFKRYTHSLFIIRYLGGNIRFCCHVRLTKLKKLKENTDVISKNLYLNNIFTLKKEF